MLSLFLRLPLIERWHLCNTHPAAALQRRHPIPLFCGTIPTAAAVLVMPLQRQQQCRHVIRLHVSMQGAFNRTSLSTRIFLHEDRLPFPLPANRRFTCLLLLLHCNNSNFVAIT